MASMNATRIHGYGAASGLVYEEAPRPVAGESEVLIRNHASSVNPFDCAVRAGYLTGWYPYTFPLILGLDISGVVAEVGPGVTEFAPGDAVWARADPARNGAYAEYVSVATSEVAAKPKSVDHLRAAALPHVGLTSWRALVDVANLEAGQAVLIHAAAGGVGSFAVQLAKSRGAKVYGTASSNNIAFLRELGVDEAIDYTTTRFEDAVQQVDAVLDTVGDETQERSWGVIKPGGILLSVVQAPSEEAAARHGVRQQFVGGFPPAGEVLREIAALVDAGAIKPIIAGVHPVTDVPAVHELVEGRHTRGKHVLQIAG
jgi:NADPH:quinone reductase-like Zn-dependent oxidoreductase